MINQLLDDPKLTARKYREWKVMNTLLIQDIYQQQHAPPAPEGSPQELKKDPSSVCADSSIWKRSRTPSSYILLQATLQEDAKNLHFSLKGKLKFLEDGLPIWKYSLEENSNQMQQNP